MEALYWAIVHDEIHIDTEGSVFSNIEKKVMKRDEKRRTEREGEGEGEGERGRGGEREGEGRGGDAKEEEGKRVP